jgi:periplasmic divalent cation tolerance protein
LRVKQELEPEELEIRRMLGALNPEWIPWYKDRMVDNPTAAPAPTDFAVVLVTVPNEEFAVRLAHDLVAEKLAACVNVLPSVRSVYAWEGEICNEGELLCLVKTRRALFSVLRDRVRELHPYEVPEIIALPLVAGSEPYLAWLRDNTRAW